MPFANETTDGACAHRLLKGELHTVRAHWRGRETDRPLCAHLLVKQHAALRGLMVGLVQNGQIHLPGGPFTLGKKGGIFILLAHDIDLCLTLMGGIIAPPSAKRGELHGRLAVKYDLANRT